MKKQIMILACLVGCCLSSSPAADAWRHVTKQDGLPGDEIQFLRQDESGTVWIGTLSGLGCFREGKFVVVKPDGEFWDVLQMGSGRYWFGTGNGVLSIDGEKQATDLAGNTITPVLHFKDADIWALSKGKTNSVIMERSGGAWAPVKRFEKERVTDMFQDRDGAIWVAVDGDGVFMVRPKDGPDATTHYLAAMNVTTMRQDSKGRIWCGLWGKGLAVLENGVWTQHLVKEKAVVLSIREDSKGQIWVATNSNGLWRFDGKTWVNDLADEGPINLLETTSDGRVWISSQAVGGLRYWDGSQWQVSLDTPLPIRCLLETKDKQLWAGSVLEGIYLKP